MRKIKKLYDDNKKKLSELGISCGEVTKLSINSKAKSRAGRTTRFRDVGCREHFEIELSNDVLDETKTSDDIAATVMLHELLHTVEGCQNHGKKWKKLACEVNRKYGTQISIVKNPELYRHDNCPGKIKRIK